jgi:hypothetical protein
VPREALAHHAPEVAKQVAVTVPEPLDEARRTLDVGEEEGDRPAREPVH